MFVNGGLAQLGERLAGSQKVRGSSPLSSTLKRSESATFENREWRFLFWGYAGARVRNGNVERRKYYLARRGANSTHTPPKRPLTSDDPSIARRALSALAAKLGDHFSCGTSARTDIGCSAQMRALDSGGQRR